MNITTVPSDFSQYIIISITGGNTKAKAVEHKAPMSDMKRLNFGTP